MALAVAGRFEMPALPAKPLVTRAPPLIRGEGTAEATWALCPAVLQAPAWALDDWLDARARLVVVAPHPDDEVLACGGLVACHAARGGEVSVLAVTEGDASHDDCAEWSRAALAAVRRRESAAGLALLTGPGGRPSQRLSLALPDGAVAAHAGHLLATLQTRLRSDDVVVTTWERDGHPDHDATAAVTAHACRAVGCRLLAAPVWMWHWARCNDPRVPWHRLRRLCLGDEAWRRKQLALGAHASQLRPRSSGAGPVLGQSIVQRAARRCEYYFA